MKLLNKTLLIAFPFLLCLTVACSSDKKDKVIDKPTKLSIDGQKLKGTYKGDFGGSPIYITLNYLSANNVAGYNVHKGLRRNIHGVIKKGDNDTYVLMLSEPGDNEFDGTFSITLQPDFMSANGEWKPNSSGLKEKQFTLSKVVINQDDEFDPIGSGYELMGEHSDVSFDNDGTCVLNYYEKINDSTFVQQMNTLKGTWEKDGDKVRVNWQPNQQFNKRTTIFEIKYYTEEGTGEKRPTTIEGDGFEFSLIMAG
ncbi:hypothetical protein [Solitalea canadensis]|uniref:Lipoprotein n=1 Tax=Solitalea canadensis (strain ATCC 29591 / DSM 3403 / JCM 21819 / LMG 8368 / NBRC 15130 / NCIMB 12057 / USAM 9D) TaxID=929556 RepID=H8KT27_SOLCM|nr:hypothetical protein [Solitalea canadensis]AFD05598.1 hypothetical protein Solca_0466 [Solitalea canadensis DSM 3403]